MKKTKGEIIAYISVGVVSIIFMAFYFRGKEVNEKIEEVKLNVHSNTYATKLEALKAKQKEEQEKCFTSKNWSEYDKQLAEKERKEQQEIEDKKAREEIKKIQKQNYTVRRHKANAKSIKPKRKGKSLAQIQKEEEVRRKMKLEEKRRRKAALEGSFSTINKQKKGFNKESFFAVIHKTQKVSRGETVMIRTKENIKTPFVTIPKNTLLFGLVNFSNTRVTIDINSIKVRNQIYPVKFTVFGSDGIRGIPISIDKVNDKVNSQLQNELYSQASAATKGLSNVVASLGKSIRNEKKQIITLIDNQTLYLQVVKTKLN